MNGKCLFDICQFSVGSSKIQLSVFIILYQMVGFLGRQSTISRKQVYDTL